MNRDTKKSLIVNDVPPDRGKMAEEMCPKKCRTRPVDRRRHNITIQRLRTTNDPSSSLSTSSDCEERQDDDQRQQQPPSVNVSDEKKIKMTKTPPDSSNSGSISQEEEEEVGETVDDDDDEDDCDEEEEEEEEVGELVDDDDDDCDEEEEERLEEGLSESSYGWVSLCGRRRAMEDAVAMVPSLLKFSTTTSNGGACDYYGVYDGHGGSAVAHVCRERLHQVIKEEVETVVGGVADWEKVMERGFGRVDEEVRERGVEMESINSVGSTAVVALVNRKRVVVANCGDSRAVLSRAGAALPLSHDHKPDRPDEMERVEAAGGRVVDWYGCRVFGVLATSRSIGDQYLKPYVISVPEVTVKERTEEDEFLILASDGLWDVMSNEVACKMVRKCFECARLRDEERRSRAKDDAAESSSGGSGCSSCSSSGESAPAAAAAMLAELALARGSKDNITIVVVDLFINRPTY